MPDRRVLIIDDEPGLAGLLEASLENEGYAVRLAHTGSAGLSAAEAGFDGVVLLDLRLPDLPGLDVLQALLQANPSNRIVIMTAHGSIDSAIEATRRGAYDFLTKSEDLPGRVRVSVKNAFRDREMSGRVSELEEAASARDGFRNLVARSPEMTRVFQTLRHAIDSRVTVLIQGESGTGKELVARALHTGGQRASGPFVALNCAGIPDTLLESELFGHERGAFTGAVAAKKGKFELADGGTIFLDEIGEMSLHLQSKILRVLETREVDRLGGSKPVKVDVRIVSATHRDLEEMVAQGEFREDLYYRLAVFPIRLPALRERQGDVPLLVDHFLRRSAKEEGKDIAGVDPDVMDCLEAHTYPGNVRELENIISRAVVVSSGTRLSLADLPRQVLEATKLRRLGAERADMEALAPDISLDRAFELLFRRVDELPDHESVEAALIRRALRLLDGDVTQAAEVLGISRPTLYRRLERLGGKEAVLALGGH
ncbi:MAG: sigma-54 dependent transcriptional regulator [Myxococcota bacterium]